uniref:Uncharacterized protein n=1 Tax=Bos indicus x Bos taurus TaxID=30522 RepID=A0A4W2CNG5_BOBOX
MLRLLASTCARGLGGRGGSRRLVSRGRARPVAGLCDPSRRLSRQASDAPRNQPPSPEFVARSVGICSMMRLPVQATPEGLDAAFVGVPLDIGTSNRPGARFGPRRIREESVLLRTTNPSTGAVPFQFLRVADLGDVNVNLYNLQDSCRLIRADYQKIVAAGCVPLTLGGDHTITYPILQAIAEKHGPVGLVHVDAHMDMADKALGEKLYHGTPFRRCVDEGLLDCKRVVQIGIRGSSTTLDTYRYSRSQGFREPQFEHCSEIPFWVKSNQWMLGTEGQSLACVHMLFLDSLGYDHQSVSRSVHSHDPGSTALLFLGVLLITPHNVLSGTLLSITLIISHVHSELWTMLGFLFPIGYQKAHCLMGLPLGR